MRLTLQTVLDELQRLKVAGQSTVSVSEESLTRLRDAVSRRVLASEANQEPPLAMPRPGVGTLSSAATTSAPASPSSTQGPVYTRRQEDSGGPSVLESYLSNSTKATRPAPSSGQSEQGAGRFPAPPEFILPEGDKATRMAWLLTRAQGDSTARSLVRPGRTPLLGSGNLDAKIMLITEAPFAEDECQTAPVAGSAADLLNRMIQGMGLRREELYHSGITTWRPHLATAIAAEANGPLKDSREPNLHELAYCIPFLKAQIDIIRPEILVAFGATTAKGLLGSAAVKSLLDVRGQWLGFHDRPLLVTYHPSYLLHKATEGKLAEKKAKRIVWEDLLKVMEKAGLPISDKQRAYFV